MRDKGKDEVWGKMGLRGGFKRSKRERISVG